MIWNHTETPQQGIAGVKDPNQCSDENTDSLNNMDADIMGFYIFRHHSESMHTQTAELINKPAWVCATDGTSLPEVADNGMIIHQQFPLFIAYWSIPEATDSRFIMHELLGLSITLPIPLDAISEESLNIQQNRDIWLEEALAAVAVRKNSWMQHSNDYCAEDVSEDIDEVICLDGRAISYTEPMDYSNSMFSRVPGTR